MTLQVGSPACQEEEDEDTRYHACIDRSDTGSSSYSANKIILVVVERIQSWFYESAWPGMGLFGESYLLFSIGTLKPVWEILYPDCVVNHLTCSRALTSSLSYSVVLGVIAGMITIGYLANHIGRRAGSILTASLMATGAIGMVFTSMIFSQHPQTLFRSMVLLLAIFGVGVGGEYPLSAASASEKCMSTASSSPSSTRRNNNKGQQVLLVFTMQGMGIFVNSVSQSILLVIFRQYGHHVIINDGNNDVFYQYDPAKLFYTWRIIYAIGAAFLCYVLVSRVIHLKESAAWAKDREEQSRSQDHPTEGVATSSSVTTTTVTDSSKAAWFLLVRHYGVRLFGASSAWLLWDVSFYGNKLFQSTFIKALTGEHSSLLQLSSAASLNAFVALLGYFAAASIIDFTTVGRVRLQLWGFALTGILFLSCGLLYQSLSTTWLVTLYLGSSFFGQCGPNATTFLIPSEIFPTEIRTMCHGIAASFGKVGALISAILFNYLDEISLFYVSGYCSFIACAITFLTIPETVSLDLTELDRHWRSLREGEQQAYSGPATQPEFLSVYEAQECCVAEASTTKSEQISIPLNSFA